MKLSKAMTELLREMGKRGAISLHYKWAYFPNGPNVNYLTVKALFKRGLIETRPEETVLEFYFLDLTPAGRSVLISEIGASYSNEEYVGDKIFPAGQAALAEAEGGR